MEQDTYLPEPGNFTGDRINDYNTLFPVEAKAHVEIQVQGLLSKAGITEEVIYEYKKGVEPLVGLERIPEGDEHLLSRIKAMDRELVNRRNQIKKICELGRRNPNIWRNAWIDTEKQYTREFEQIEAPLKRLLSDYKAEQERKEAEEKARQEAIKRKRYMDLEALGFARRYRVDGTQVYFLGETEFEVEAIDNADHETFSNMVASARMVAEEIRAAKEEQERKAQEAARLLAEQQEAMRKEKEALEAQRLELERQKAEVARQQAQVESPKQDEQVYESPWEEEVAAPANGDLDKLRELLREVETVGVFAKKTQEKMSDPDAIRAVDVTRELLRSSHKNITIAIDKLTSPQ